MYFGTRTIKYIMLFYNIIFGIGGMAVLSIGTIIRIEMRDQPSRITGWITIISGTATIIVSCFSCYGIIRRKRYVMSSFLNTVSSIILLQVIIGSCVTLSLNFESRSDEWENNMTKLYQKQWNQTENGTIPEIDTLQRHFKCCGVENYREFINYGKEIPASCCNNGTTELTKMNQTLCETTSTNLYHDGCRSKQQSFYRGFKKYLSMTLFLSSGIDFIGLVLVFYFIHTIRPKYTAIL